MDKTDTKLLALLLADSRMPITVLARKLHVSREIAQYRLERFRNQQIIKSFFADIDLERLGYIGAAFFLVVKATRYEELKTHIEHANYVSWAAEWSGSYSIGMTIIARTIAEIDQHVRDILEKFDDTILSHEFILHRKNTFFYEKYFCEALATKKVIMHNTVRSRSIVRNITNMQKNMEDLDKKDIILLHSLSQNSRVNAVELASKLKISAVAVAKRIKKLEQQKYINKYSVFIDVNKLKLYQYSIFINTHELNHLEALKAHLKIHPSVNFIAEYVGDQFFEFGIFVKEPYELKKILLDIEQKFPHYTFTRIALLQQEFISTGPPKCVFER